MQWNQAFHVPEYLNAGGDPSSRAAPLIHLSSPDVGAVFRFDLYCSDTIETANIASHDIRAGMGRYIEMAASIGAAICYEEVLASDFSFRSTNFLMLSPMERRANLPGPQTWRHCPQKLLLMPQLAVIREISSELYGISQKGGLSSRPAAAA